MKLKNKKTGKMCELKVTVNGDLTITKDDEIIGIYSSLAELNSEWEDYEEPKEYWFVGDHQGVYKTYDSDNLISHQRKEIGNYFETEEEAEKAVEKLKAWKRLKDKGFRFDVVPALGHCDDEKFDISIIATMPAKWWYNDKVVDDIHYVFGGEE